MPSRAVPASTRNVLKSLGARPEIAGPFYLAGGTALALRLDHRISEDLDLFTPDEVEPDLLAARLEGAVVTAASKGTLHVLLAGVRVSFLHYPPPLLYATSEEEGIRVADARDVGVMKLAAAAGRGLRRDFVDLYVLAKRVAPLDALLTDFQRRFGDTYSRYHLLRSLAYFDDAEHDPPLRLLDALSWDEVKAFLAAEQRRLFAAGAP